MRRSILRSIRPGALRQAWRSARLGLRELLRISSPEVPEMVNRIAVMERDIVLPIKLAGVAMLLYSFYFSPWILLATSALDVAVEAVQYFFWIYVLLNVLVAVVLLNMHRIQLAALQWIVFVTCLIDGLFVSALTLMTGGYDSFLYWLFLGLIIRAAVSVPRATSQLMLNTTMSLCYVVAGLVDIGIAENLDDTTRLILGFTGPYENIAEPLLLRLILLLLMTLCCYGVQVLVDRHRRVVEEAREFALREGQLRSAGRLAAEFAHQIKNPLAIINNAAFSMQRALRDGKAPSVEHARIIQEEVERSDRIITQIMGYSQLTEGRVEKLDVVQEMEAAIRRVFPPEIESPIQVETSFGTERPSLVMLRRHLSETFVNLLQNAREALDGGKGQVKVFVRRRGERSVEVVISDTGPGIPPDRQEQVFEAYYTTKEKGTGLGLATVKHNVELYGGTVRMESELGKGTQFILNFPVRTLSKLAQ